MAHDANHNHIAVYVEVGQTRTFAGALDWPGWCRSGRDEASALHALYAYSPRYARALQTTRLVFHAPSEVAAFVVVERLAGNATTDFGAPNVALARDLQPIDPIEVQRWQEVLHACWQTFDTAVQAITRTGQALPRISQCGWTGIENRARVNAVGVARVTDGARYAEECLAIT